MKVGKLGDKMPDTRDPKWGSMKAGESHLSDEWRDMEPSTPQMSEKYDHMTPSVARMSERYVEMNPSSPKMSEKWVDMKQEGRTDPYSMAPNYDDRTVGMKKQSSNPMKNSGHGRYEVRGSEGQSGKGL